MDGIDASGESIGYRPVSKLAVAGVIAGLVSSLALASPMLWVLPLVGVGLAIAGLADVSTSGAEKAGRSLALAGLALSVGFGAQAVTSSVASRWIMQDRARCVVESWLGSIRDGRLSDAQAMVTSDVVGPEEAAVAHAGHDHEHEVAEKMTEAFLKVPAVAAIQACGPGAAWEIQGTGPDATAVGAWGAIARLSPCAGGRSVEIALQLTPTVIKERGGRIERWMVTKADLVP